jgi:hypothetical protein
MGKHARRIAEFRALVNERGARLRELSFAELARLQRAPLGPVGENHRIDSRDATIVTIVEPGPDGSLRVIVHGRLDWRFWPGSYDVAMDGFYKHPDGSIAAMSDREFLEFD